MRLLPLLVLGLGSLVARADLLEANRDPAVAPTHDFWLHANARWNAAHPVAADRASYYSYDWQEDFIRQDLLDLNRTLVALPKPTDKQRKIADFWKSALAFEQNKSGLPMGVTAALAKLDSTTTPQGFAELAAELMEQGVGSFLGVYADQDAKDENTVVLYLGQAGTSLPERAHYFSDEPATKKVRDAFPAYVTRMLKHMGYDQPRAEQAGKDILALETRFAEVSRPLEQLEDPEKNYNLMTLAQVDALTPGVSWAPVLQRLKAPVVKQLVVGQPEFFQGFAKILATTPPQVLRDYLRFHTMTAYAAILNGQTSQDNFAFTGVVLSGAKQQRSLEDRALALQDRTIGDLVGEEYVARRFGPAQRERFRLVCEGVRTAFAKRLAVNPWMDAPTREWALKKLAAVKLRVGYTDKFRQFDGVRITSDSLAENVLAVDQWETRRAYARVGGAPEREEWGMRPYTVNAYYNPLNNEIVLPAAILTVPAYAGNDLDDAVLYGYIATTIGHEITHGFDDSGRRFSATGRMENGWTPATEKAFEARCAKLIAQYDREEPLKGIHINGKQTLSENIADLGGLALALDAFQQTETYKSGKLIAGQTPLQRFFLAYAFSFAGNVRDEQLATRLLSDTHSPAKARINLIVRNLDAFYEAFPAKPSDALYLEPKGRVRIW